PTTTVPASRVAGLITRQPSRFSMGQAGSTKSSDTEPGHRLSVRFSTEEGEAPYRFLHWVFRQLERE
ncbi:MAG TPA: hypothetical protein DFR83_11430, partial [Deltaproteobacteria bacterium]|nr:hypothetical protein [Deltaproteobacteria bacterium]